MSSALNDSGITNNGLVGISSANQIGNQNNMSVANSAGDSWINGYRRDPAAFLPSWMDWITGFDRNFDNLKYQQWLSDTAIQRRVADAKLAGINPLFAIGPNSAADSNVSFGQDTGNSGFKNFAGSLAKLALLFLFLK